MPQDANLSSRASDAVWASLANTTQWLGAGVSPSCAVGPACAFSDGAPCRVQVTVAYPTDGGGLGLYSMLGFFDTFAPSAQDASRLSGLLGSQATAQIMAPVAAFAATAP